MRTKHLTVAAITLLAVPGLAGCNGGADATPPATNTVSPQVSAPASSPAETTTATSTPTAAPPSTTTPIPKTSTPKSPQATAAAARARAANTVLDAYIKEMNRLYADPTLPQDQLPNVAQGDALAFSIGAVNGLKKTKRHIEGTTTFVTREVKTNALSGGLGVVGVKACMDVSRTRVLDSTGKDVTSPTRKGRVIQIYAIAEVKGSHAWKVSLVDSQGESC